jgi:cysteinyl-tRNA synthetase
MKEISLENIRFINDIIPKFHNSLHDKLEDFEPINKENIGMYVCGPTVYDRPHIGNARSAVIFDVLYRILLKSYPKVTYVRNVTDVDDKILDKAKQLNIDPFKLAKDIEILYNEDLNSLNCLHPSITPRATEHIQEMIEIIQKLLDKGFAYQKDGNVLFDIMKYKEYGSLSNRKIDEMISGTRFEVEDYKKHELDFVLWKPSDKSEPGFDSPFGYGRPGWHIECSAMSSKYLSNSFDIHGGGADLKFPHHENEIAQSICANGGIFAKYWIHNGFVMVEGEKMSKSLGNFITVKDLIDQGVNGEVIRYALLSTHYQKPLNFTHDLLDRSFLALQNLYKVAFSYDFDEDVLDIGNAEEVITNNLNTVKYIAMMHTFAKDIIDEKSDKNKRISVARFRNMGKLLGFFSSQDIYDSIFNNNIEIPKDIDEMAKMRVMLKNEKKYKEADEVREKISSMGYNVLDSKDGYKIVKK